MNTTPMNTPAQSLSLGRARVTPSTLMTALMAFTLGMALVYAVGFAQPELLHNAAHDWRHSMNFPCH